MIRQNIIHSLPVTAEDVEIAEKIFGPDVSILKVKTTRQTPKVVVDYFIEIPRELVEKNQDLILCMDIIFINKQALFTTIDKNIWFRGLFTLSNRTKEECYRALSKVMRHYNKSVFLLN